MTALTSFLRRHQSSLIKATIHVSVAVAAVAVVVKIAVPALLEVPERRLLVAVVIFSFAAMVKS